MIFKQTSQTTQIGYRLYSVLTIRRSFIIMRVVARETDYMKAKSDEITIM